MPINGPYSMIGKLFTTIANNAIPYVPGTEANAIKNFLENSDDYKKLCVIISKYNESNREYHSAHKLLNDINEANDFNQLLKALECFDYVNSNDPSVKDIGRTGLNMLFYVVGFVENSANIAYYGLHLREKVVIKMDELGYVREVPRSSPGSGLTR